MEPTIAVGPVPVPTLAKITGGPPFMETDAEQLAEELLMFHINWMGLPVVL